MKILITGESGIIISILKNNLQMYHISIPTHQELDLLNVNSIIKFLLKKEFDIVIHCAVQGDSKTKEEKIDIIYNNLLMFENILHFKNKFKMILNMDSAAIYDRTTDINNRKVLEYNSIPNDYFGFSKYLIYNKSLIYKNVYNIRIFNIFHPDEENENFIKSCFNAKKTGSKLIIHNYAYIDFVYYNDFIELIKYYIDNINNINNINNILEKTVNVCYNEKYKLSDIVKIIENIDIYKKIDYDIISESDLNYTGYNNSKIIYSGLINSLINYNKKN